VQTSGYQKVMSYATQNAWSTKFSRRCRVSLVGSWTISTAPGVDRPGCTLAPGILPDSRGCTSCPVRFYSHRHRLAAACTWSYTCVYLADCGSDRRTLFIIVVTSIIIAKIEWYVSTLSVCKSYTDLCRGHSVRSF